jgi:septal ring factor EnvC (AmiA/AmiB activator)
VLQDSPVDLSRVPGWVGLLIGLAPSAVWLVQRLRKGVKAEGDERTAEIEKAVKPYRELSEVAGRRLEHCQGELMEERAERERVEQRAKRLEERLEEATEERDQLQAKVMRIQGRQDEAERRLDRLEGRGA